MINSTKIKVDRILNEIQNDKVDATAFDNRVKSMEEVMAILLSNNSFVSATELQQVQNANFIDVSFFDINEMMRWRNNNNNIYQLKTHWPITSHRKWIGNLIVFGKKVVRKLLGWYINPIAEQQNAINGSFTASINALCNNELVTAEQLQLLHNQINAIDDKYNGKILELENKHQEELQKMHDLYTKKFEQPYSAIDYVKFEEYFRGNEQDIKTAQAMYIPYFGGKNNVLDLGCGRGEFLELLDENNISATGVDVYEEFVNQCKDKKLNAVYADAVSYLAQQQDNSLGGIFSAQLVEHLSVDDIVSLCNLSYQKLKDGGCIIIETLNPLCMSIYFNSFYLDPTHEKPIHPKTLEYFLKQAGFENCEVIYTEQSKINYRLPLLEGNEIHNLAEFNDGINFLSDIIFGSQDYAIIARK